MNQKMRSIRQALDLSIEAVAHDVGISTAQLSRYECGKKDPHLGELKKIARRLGVSLAELIDESGGKVEYVNIKTVPVKGLVAAGLWFEFTDLQHETFDPIPAIPTKFAGAEQFAFRVVGPSMDKRRIFDGDYVVCVAYWDARQQIESGDLIVIEKTEGNRTERTCKEVAVSRDGFEFWPRSADARFQTPFKIPFAQDNRPDDSLNIKIVGLVIGVFSPR